MHVSVWLKTDSNPADINRFRSHAGKFLLILFSAIGNVQTECLRAVTIPLISQAQCESMYEYSSQRILNSKLII